MLFLKVLRFCYPVSVLPDHPPIVAITYGSDYPIISPPYVNNTVILSKTNTLEGTCFVKIVRIAEPTYYFPSSFNKIIFLSPLVNPSNDRTPTPITLSFNKSFSQSKT
jgi:hypothetical protein